MVSSILNIDEIISAAKKLYGRASWVAKIDRILTTVYGDKQGLTKDFHIWANKNSRKHFLEDYYHLLLRALVLEVCVIFDQPNGARQYSLDFLVNCLGRYIQDTNNTALLFQNPNQINLVDFSGFFIIGKQKCDILKDQDILNLLIQEKKLFNKKYKDNLATIKEYRHKFLAHPDLDARDLQISIDGLMDMSQWCFSFTNLIMNLLTAGHGAVYYIEESRKKILDSIHNDYFEIFSELIKN